MILALAPYKGDSLGTNSFFLDIVATLLTGVFTVNGQSDFSVVIPSSPYMDIVAVNLHVTSGTFSIEYTSCDPSDVSAIWDEWSFGAVSAGGYQLGSMNIPIGGIRLKGVADGTCRLTIRELNRRL